MQKRAFLREVDIFAQLSDGELDVLCGIAHEFKVPHGTAVFKEKDPTTALFIVREGSVELVRGEARARIARIERGQIFGELALFEDRPRSSAAISAMAPETTLYTISKTDLEAAFQAHPVLAAKVLRGVLKRVAQRLRAADDAIQTLLRSAVQAWS